MRASFSNELKKLMVKRLMETLTVANFLIC